MPKLRIKKKIKQTDRLKVMRSLHCPHYQQQKFYRKDGNGKIFSSLHDGKTQETRQWQSQPCKCNLFAHSGNGNFVAPSESVPGLSNIFNFIHQT